MTIMVDPALLTHFMDQISTFGATPEGGLNREAGTRDHAAARNWFFGELRRRGYQTRVMLSAMFLLSCRPKGRRMRR